MAVRFLIDLDRIGAVVAPVPRDDPFKARHISEIRGSPVEQRGERLKVIHGLLCTDPASVRDLIALPERGNPYRLYGRHGALAESMDGKGV